MTVSKVAIVTGAGSGIGRAVSIALLARGYKVALLGRTREGLDGTSAMGGTGPGTALPVITDVRRKSAVDAAIDATLAACGRIDLLFNNAGIFGPNVLFEDIETLDWEQVIATNLTGAFLMAQGVFRAMKQQVPQGGRIINNGSISAHAPRPNSAPYTATKHAITGLTRALSLDGRKYHIACGQIDVGNASTPMTHGLATAALQPNGARMAEPTFDVRHVGEAVVAMAELPLEANVQFMTIMASAMPFIGRG
jgi:NAD(P)-dependent dehydrogenase (short-subunit alcohol dehydrogenase family)